MSSNHTPPVSPRATQPNKKPRTERSETAPVPSDGGEPSGRFGIISRPAQGASRRVPAARPVRNNQSGAEVSRDTAPPSAQWPAPQSGVTTTASSSISAISAASTTSTPIMRPTSKLTNDSLVGPTSAPTLESTESRSSDADAPEPNHGETGQGLSTMTSAPGSAQATSSDPAHTDVPELARPRESLVDHAENHSAFVRLFRVLVAQQTPHLEAPYYAVWSSIVDRYLTNHQYCHEHHAITLSSCFSQLWLSILSIEAAASVRLEETDADTDDSKDDEDDDQFDAGPRGKRTSTRIPDFNQQSGILYLEGVPKDWSAERVLSLCKNSRDDGTPLRVTLLAHGIKCEQVQALRTTLLVENKPRLTKSKKDASEANRYCFLELRQMYHQAYHFFAQDSNANFHRIGGVLAFGTMFTYLELTRKAALYVAESEFAERDDAEWKPINRKNTRGEKLALQMRRARALTPVPQEEGLEKQLHCTFADGAQKRFFDSESGRGSQLLRLIEARAEELAPDVWLHMNCEQPH